MQGTLYVQECGCEDLDTAFNPISFCTLCGIPHKVNMSP